MRNKDKFPVEKVPLSSSQCNILKLLLDEGYPLTQDEMSKRTKMGVSGVFKALKKLFNYGLIGRIKQNLLSYIINPHRKEEIKIFLTGYDFGKNKPLILDSHNCVFEAEINDLPLKWAKVLEKNKSFIKYVPNNWIYAFSHSFPEGSFVIKKTLKRAKIVYYLKTFGSDPAIMEQINYDKFFELKQKLEESYSGLKIGNSEIVATCPFAEYAIQKDYISVAGIRSAIKHKKIEQSNGYPEWEEKGYNAREKIQKVINLRERETLLLG